MLQTRWALLTGSLTTRKKNESYFAKDARRFWKEWVRVLWEDHDFTKKEKLLKHPFLLQFWLMMRLKRVSFHPFFPHPIFYQFIPKPFSFCLFSLRNKQRSAPKLFCIIYQHHLIISPCTKKVSKRTSPIAWIQGDLTIFVILDSNIKVKIKVLVSETIPQRNENHPVSMNLCLFVFFICLLIFSWWKNCMVTLSMLKLRLLHAFLIYTTLFLITAFNLYTLSARFFARSSNILMISC